VSSPGASPTATTTTPAAGVRRRPRRTPPFLGQLRYHGYRGVLTVTGRGTGSRATVRVTIPDVPPGADTELARGLGETLDTIDQLTRT
jgi:hypothetical protein